MDRIYLEGLEFFGFHGVHPLEKQQGQKFIIDAVLYTDLRPAGASDNLNLTVDYGQVYEEIRTVVEKDAFNLIETLAETIARRILAHFPVQSVKVRVNKPQAPVKGKFRTFAVEVERSR